MIDLEKFLTSQGAKELFFVSVENKNGIGGIERLVADLHKQLNKNKITESIFYLSKNKKTHKFFAKSMSRKIILFWRTFELLFFICLKLIKYRNRKIVILFFHSECHVIQYWLRKIFHRFNRISTVTYLCQSPILYPKKLLEYGRQAAISSDFIWCYSGAVARMWEPLIDRAVSSIWNPVDIDRIKRVVFTESHSKSILKFIHVGRPVKFKSPEKSLEFAILTAQFVQSVKLTFVGLSHLANIDKNKIPPNLEIEYKGLVLDPLVLVADSTAMLSFGDFESAGEVLGISALESLCLGVPVCVENLNHTDYKNLPGIYTRETFLEKIPKDSGEHYDWDLRYRVNHKQVEDLRNKLSSERYLGEIIDKLNLG
jgi:glycosyltransferase involved in cell wall biosynthesis